MNSDVETRVRSSLRAYADLVEERGPAVVPARPAAGTVRRWRAPALVSAAAVLAVLGSVWLVDVQGWGVDPVLAPAPTTVEAGPEVAGDRATGSAAPEAAGPDTGDASIAKPGAPSVGVPYLFELYTHCGITGAWIGGVWFAAVPPLVDGAGGPPAGWANPSQPGTLTLLTSQEALFRDPAGHQVRFRAAPGSEPPPCD
jgi:hypothetical protein